jgi:transposase
LAVDTLGHLLALHVTPADVGDRQAVARLAAGIQEATGETVKLAYVDQGYTGDKAAEAAAAEGITLEVVKLPEAKRGFVLLFYCRGDGLLKDSLHGPHVAADLSKTTSNMRKHLLASTSSPSSDTCSNTRRPW